MSARPKSNAAGPAGAPPSGPAPAADRPALPGPLDTARARRVGVRVGTARPAGCDSECTSALDTPAGRVLVRSRRYTWAARVHVVAGPAYGGGLDYRTEYVVETRVEVAVSTPRTRESGEGFVAVWDGLGYDGPRLTDHLTAYLAAAEWVETALARREARARSAERRDRPPRRVRPAGTTWEALRRLLNVRCAQLQRWTGWDAGEARHEAALAASGGRTASSLGLDGGGPGTEEVEHACSHVEDAIYRAGYAAEMEREDLEYEARRLASRQAPAPAMRPGRAAA